MTDDSPKPPNRGRIRLSDTSGAFGAIVAALCCAGTPFLVGAVTAVGLSALLRDAVLWPVMLISLGIAIWGFWRGRQIHGSSVPLILGVFGGASLATGVIFVHGPPAMEMIYGGVIALVVATGLNIKRRLK